MSLFTTSVSRTRSTCEDVNDRPHRPGSGKSQSYDWWRRDVDDGGGDGGVPRAPRAPCPPPAAGEKTPLRPRTAIARAVRKRHATPRPRRRRPASRADDTAHPPPPPPPPPPPRGRPPGNPGPGDRTAASRMDRRRGRG